MGTPNSGVVARSLERTDGYADPAAGIGRTPTSRPASLPGLDMVAAIALDSGR